MNWTEFLGLAASAGLFSAALSAVVLAIGAWLKQRRHARYLALRLAIQMDGYFQLCLGRILEIQNHNSSGGHAGQLHVSVPSPPDSPSDDAGWINISPKHADRALSFALRVNYMNRAICDNIENDGNPPDEPDTSLTLTYLYETAEDAYRLAQELRNSYRFRHLKHSDESFEWLVKTKNRHADLVSKEEARRLEHAHI